MTHDFWKRLEAINPKYPHALSLYSNYLIKIKNDNELGEEYRARYTAAKKKQSLEDIKATFDVLFEEDTCVFVMSGTKQGNDDSQQKILKTS